MNSSNENIHAASGVAQDKKIRVWAFGRAAASKSSYVYSPPQVDCNWKPINAFSTRLGRQKKAAHSICTRVGPKHRNLRLGN